MLEIGTVIVIVHEVEVEVTATVFVSGFESVAQLGDDGFDEWHAMSGASLRAGPFVMVAVSRPGELDNLYTNEDFVYDVGSVMMTMDSPSRSRRRPLPCRRLLFFPVPKNPLPSRYCLSSGSDSDSGW